MKCAAVKHARHHHAFIIKYCCETSPKTCSHIVISLIVNESVTGWNLWLVRINALMSSSLCHLSPVMPAGCFYLFVSRLAVKRRSSASHLSVSLPADDCESVSSETASHSTLNLWEERRSWTSLRLFVFLPQWRERVSLMTAACVVLCIYCGIFTPLVKMQFQRSAHHFSVCRSLVQCP